MNRHAATAVAGLLAAGALVVPVAQAKPPTPEELANELNSIPDPSTVPDAPQTVTDDPADAPAPGEPPDPESGDEDPYAAVTPDPTAIPTVVATEVSIVVATPVATAAATVEAISTPAPVAAEVTATPVATATPEPTVAQEPAPVAQEADAQALEHAKADRRRARTQEKRQVARAKRKARLAEAHGQSTAVQTGPQVPSTPVTTQRRQPTRVVAVRTRAGKSRLGARTYLIQPGDTLSGIAARFGLSWPRLAVLNDLDDPNLIYAGDTLILG